MPLDFSHNKLIESLRQQLVVLKEENKTLRRQVQTLEEELSETREDLLQWQAIVFS
jgi:cell division protein FtsB